MIGERCGGRGPSRFRESGLEIQGGRKKEDGGDIRRDRQMVRQRQRETDSRRNRDRHRDNQGERERVGGGRDNMLLCKGEMKVGTAGCTLQP